MIPLTSMPDDFSAAYDLYQSDILHYCLWKSRDREVGLDLTQETFLRFYLCLQRQQQILHARAFLYRIAHNLFINHMRKKKETSLDHLLEAGFEPSIDPWHETHTRLDAERPLQALKKMRGPYRQVLTGRFIHGLAPREIAKVTGETSNTVSVRIFRGLKYLRFLTSHERRQKLPTSKRSYGASKERDHGQPSSPPAFAARDSL